MAKDVGVPVYTTQAAARPLFFSRQQKTEVAVLAELIIPADGVAPEARAAMVGDYVDFVLAHATHEEQRAWTEGLKMLDGRCQERFAKAFVDLSSVQQQAVVRELPAGEFAPHVPLERFFARVKRSVAGAFYTSKIGLMED